MSKLPLTIPLDYQGSYYPVIGRIKSGRRADRLELEDLQKKPKQFTLFILSYLALQEKGHKGISGIVIPAAAQFPEIAGIHGLPFREWIGDQRKSPHNRGDFDPEDPKDAHPVPSRFGGYCNHGSVVFPTWHRPYVMLIEQVIGDIAVQIAEQFANNNTSDDPGEWRQAALDLRFPFWDWATEKVQKEGLPKILSDPTIEIIMPGGTPETLDNPLSFYSFKSIPPGFEDEAMDPNDPETKAYFSKWKRTFRYAKSTPTPDRSGTADLNNQIKLRAKQIRDSVGTLFTYDDDGVPPLVWDEFSNHTTESLRRMDFYNNQSLEGIHDLMHDTLGGNGHMSDPDYAGFDPIFYLHHCNVDRILAFWERVYPSYYMGRGYPDPRSKRIRPFTQARGTYNLVYNSQLLGDTSLAPFRKAKEEGKEEEEYWTSDDARYLDGKYYSYPLTAGVDIEADMSKEELLAAREKLQKFYGVDPRRIAQIIIDKGADKPPIFNTPSKPPVGHALITGYRRMILVVQAPEFALNGPYTVDIYNTGSSAVPNKKDFVGTVAVFARPDRSPCAGCSMRRDAGSTVRGIIPISEELLVKIIEEEHLNSTTVTDEVIAEAIKKRLRGYIVKRNGSVIGYAQGGQPEGGMESLAHKKDSLPSSITPEITLVSSAVSYPEGDGASPVKWFDWKNHGKVFEGGDRAWSSSRSSEGLNLL